MSCWAECFQLHKQQEGALSQGTELNSTLTLIFAIPRKPKKTMHDLRSSKCSLRISMLSWDLVVGMTLIKLSVLQFSFYWLICSLCGQTVCMKEGMWWRLGEGEAEILHKAQWGMSASSPRALWITWYQWCSLVQYWLQNKMHVQAS